MIKKKQKNLVIIFKHTSVPNLIRRLFHSRLLHGYEIGYSQLGPTGIVGYLPSSFKSVRLPKLQIFGKIFCTNLQSPVWSRLVGVAPMDTNMAAGKDRQRLGLTFAI